MMQRPPHPGWAILRMTIVLGWAALMLWLSASNFDATEIKALVGMALGWSAMEVARLVRGDD